MFHFPCPACGGRKTDVSFNPMDIPHFGEVLESTARCPECNWRHVDVLVLKKDRPKRYTLKIEGEEDMNIRVVRSSTGTISVPELGVRITPGAAGEGFITNVEGIFLRIQEVLESPGVAQEQGEKAAELLEKIRRIREGKMGVTLVMEDPWGNSAIISDRAVIEELDGA
jgi:zinc finger protein